MNNAIDILRSNYETCFNNAMYWRLFKRWDAAFKYLNYAKELKMAIYILSSAERQMKDMENIKPLGFKV